MLAGFENLFLPVAQFSGGVGNIVAATLETKGLIDQAAILATFKDQLQWIAAAAWLFSICMGIGAVAVFGNYKQGAYLLLGPPLFYYMTTITIKTDGAKAIFGDRVIQGSVEEEKNLLKWVKTIGDGKETVDISFFFGIYDSIVTEVVQKTVSVMLDTKNQADLRYIARETVLSQILLTEPEEKELSSLVLTYHVGTCGDLMSKLQQEMDRKERTYVKLRNTKDIDDNVKKVLQSEWDQKNVVIDPQVKRYLLGLKSYAQGKGITIPYNSVDDQQIVSCAQIWDFTKAALFRYAELRLTAKELEKTAAKTRLPLNEAITDVKSWLEKGAGNNQQAQQVLAAFIYKNMVTKMTPAALQGQVFNRSPMNSAQYEAVFGGLGNSEAHGAYMKMKYFAASIPYIQGLLLYLLTIAFPFFAVFLVLPGKAPSFLVWCSLWAWVKSWDIGFALVHVGRDIFWHMMKHRVNLYGAKLEWGNNPGAVIRFAFQNDPLFNQNTYWIIVAALTLMVPFVTAHLAMGATGMVDMFKGSIDQVATRFSQTEGNAARRHEANITERMMEEHQARVQRAFAEQHARDSGVTTMTGKTMSLQNLRNGAFWGAIKYDEATKQYSFVGEVNDARAKEANLATRDATFALQLGTSDTFTGGREASVEKSKELASQNVQKNQRARELESKKLAGTATEADLKEYADMRRNHGYTSPEQDARIKALEEEKMQNGGKFKNDEEGKKKEADLLELQTKYEQGDIHLPEEIPHANRGSLRMGENIDQLGMERYASDQDEMAALFRRYGRENDAVRHEERAAEIRQMIAEGKHLTRGEYLQYEQGVGNNIQDRLATESRRRQHRLKRGHVAGMSNYLNGRQEAALHAQNFFDGSSVYNSIAIPGMKGILENPAGKGLKMEKDGTIFSAIKTTDYGGYNEDD